MSRQGSASLIVLVALAAAAFAVAGCPETACLLAGWVPQPPVLRVVDSATQKEICDAVMVGDCDQGSGSVRTTFGAAHLADGCEYEPVVETNDGEVLPEPTQELNCSFIRVSREGYASARINDVETNYPPPGDPCDEPGPSTPVYTIALEPLP